MEPHSPKESQAIVTRYRSPTVKAIAGTVAIFVSMPLEKGFFEDEEQSPVIRRRGDSKWGITSLRWGWPK